MKRQPTPQHITWFLDLWKNNQLVLDPPYQRKSVWTPKDRRFFIDSILRNYPTPPIFVHREISDTGFSTYNVVDGKQRLETIISFAEGKIAVDKTFFDVTIAGKKFKDLPIEYKRKFWDYVLIVDFIDSIEGNNIEEVFDRVNRNSKNLLPQELRHAKYDGWFISEAESESEHQFWWDIKVSTKAKDKRMRNVQSISELLLIIIDNKIVGFNQDYLDAMYAKYDTPEETAPNFEEDKYIDCKEKIKGTLKEMDETNGSINKYCRLSNNLYTLWALVALNYSELPDSKTLAERYKSFMEKVDQFNQGDIPEDFMPQADDKPYFDYYSNSKGASTDFPQREVRLNALSIIIAK